MAAPMRRLAAAWAKANKRTPVDMLIVHQPRRGGDGPSAVAPGARAISWLRLAETLAA